MGKMVELLLHEATTEENKREQIEKELNHIIMEVVDFQVKHKIKPAQFVIYSSIYIREIESKESVLAYDPFGLSLFKEIE